MSSSIKEQLETDIIRFFEQIESQNVNDQRQTLRNLLGKYIHLSTTNYMMDSYDLTSIISSAKSAFSNKQAKLFLKSGSNIRQVCQDELSNLFVIEATINYLNKIECFKKLPKFDYKEDK